MKSFFFSFALAMAAFAAPAQQQLVHLQRFYTQEVERTIANRDSNFHQALKPFLQGRPPLGKVKGYAPDSAKYYYLLTAKLMREHLFEIKGDDFRFAIDPLFDFSVGFDLADTSAYRDTVVLRTNTRGLMVQGDLGKQFSFQTAVIETQSLFPLYLKAIADSLGVIPGMGRHKPYKVHGYDYGVSLGAMSYSPTEWLNLRMGYGKFFIGHGYRSLLLSDASFNYPYISGHAWLWKNRLQYTAIFASLQGNKRLPRGEVPEALLEKKAATFHYLSWLPLRGLEVGLFEGVVFQRVDTTSIVKLSWTAYNPVIGLNAVTDAWDGKANVLLGANLKYKVTSQLQVYGQLMMDDPAYHSWGWQAGFKWFDLAVPNLDVQAEWNTVRGASYASAWHNQSYTQLNQPLGHPAGACNNELVVIASHRYKRFITQLKLNQAGGVRWSNCAWQANPSAQVPGSEVPVKRFMQQWDVQAGWFLNPKTNLQYVFGLTQRLDKLSGGAEMKRQTTMVYMTFRTGLLNRYFDF